MNHHDDDYPNPVIPCSSNTVLPPPSPKCVLHIHICRSVSPEPAYPHSSPPSPSLSSQLFIVDPDYLDHLTLDRVLREADVDLCRILREADWKINRADTRAEKERYPKSVMDELYLRKDAASD